MSDVHPGRRPQTVFKSRPPQGTLRPSLTSWRFGLTANRIKANGFNTRRMQIVLHKSRPEAYKKASAEISN